MALREHEQWTNLTTVNNSDPVTWVNAISGTFTPTVATTLVWVTFELSCPVTSNFNNLRLVVDGAQVSFSDPVVRSANDQQSITIAALVTGAGASHTVEAQFRPGNLQIMSVRNIRMVRLGLGPNDVTTQNLVEQSTTLITPQTALTANAGPAGDYLVLAFTMTRSSTATVPAYVNLSDGTNSTLTPVGNTPYNASVEASAPLLWKRTLTAGQAINLQYRSHTATTITARMMEARLVLLYLPDFDANLYSELGTDSSGTQTAYTDALTLSGTVSANPQLVLSAHWSYLASTTVTATVTTNLLDGATQIVEQARGGASSAADPNRANAGAAAYVRAGSAGSIALKIQRKASTAVANRVRVNSAIAVLDMGSAGGGTVHAGAMTLAGLGTLSTAGTMRQSGALSPSGSGAASLAGSFRQPAALTVVGAGALSVSGGRRQPGAVAVAGAGSISQSALRVQPGAVAVSSAGGAVWQASAIFGGAAVMAGSSSASFTGDVVGEEPEPGEGGNIMIDRRRRRSVR